MKNKQRQIIFLVILFLLIIIINYPYIDSFLTEFLTQSETGIVERVIDGDTAIINNDSVRLLGINSPERGEIYYEEAKYFLEGLILNKSVRLEFGKDRYDKYYRKLAYIFIDNKNVNLELVEKGFANFYFPSGKDVYYNRFVDVWEECVKNNQNLCGKSVDKCAECIKLKEFDYENEIIIFHNNCDFDCELTGWKIKDEGRKNFIFPEFILMPNKDLYILIGEKENNDNTLFWTGEKYVWTKSGDTLFLRDGEGKLVLWRAY